VPQPPAPAAVAASAAPSPTPTPSPSATPSPAPNSARAGTAPREPVGGLSLGDTSVFGIRGADLLANLLAGPRRDVDRVGFQLAFYLLIGCLMVTIYVAAPMGLARLVRRQLARRRARRKVAGYGPGALATTAAPLRVRKPGVSLPGPLRVAVRTARLVLHENLFVFALIAGLNLAAGAYLVFHFGYVPNDAIARVGNASYVLISRDPHLAAIGLVWNPLPSFLELPILAFHSLWPPLLTHAFAGVIETAIFGGATAVVINTALRDSGIVPPLRWLFVAAFALNPLVLLYSANGMSEIMMIFFMLWASLLFMRWSRTRATNTLVLMSVVAAAGTFVRYENWLFAVLLGVAVVVTDLRLKGWRAVETRALLYALPVAYAMLFWIGANAILEHDPLYFMHSVYSNEAQLAHAGVATGSFRGWSQAAKFVADEILNLDPAFIVTSFLLLAVVLLRRGYRRPGLGLIVVSLSAVLMQLALVAKGTSGLDLRYFMTVIPFTYLVAIYALGALRGWWLKTALALPVLVFLLMGNAYTYMTSADPRYGDDVSQESALVAAVQGQGHVPSELFAGRDVAQKVASIDRDHSLVLVDSFCGHAVTVQAADPRMYVITSDRDFEPSINEPTRHHIKYFLVPKPAFVCANDRVNVLYPEFWQSGQGFGKLVADLGGEQDWRLYQIIGPSGL